MKKGRTLLGMIGIAVIFTMVCILWNPASSEAREECYLVKINSRDNVQLSSPVVNIYDCVVFLNWTEEETPRIVFTEGRACTLSIKARTGFQHDDSGCFSTKPLNYGETASLVFSEPGFFKYVIEFKSGQKLKGTVEVK
jgi:hypothetical protein